MTKEKLFPRISICFTIFHNIHSLTIFYITAFWLFWSILYNPTVWGASHISIDKYCNWLTILAWAVPDHKACLQAWGDFLRSPRIWHRPSAETSEYTGPGPSHAPTGSPLILWTTSWCFSLEQNIHPKIHMEKTNKISGAKYTPSKTHVKPTLIPYKNTYVKPKINMM